jgi:guanylate kinase
MEIDLDNLTKEDFLEMAKYCHHLEGTNGQLIEQLREAKAMLTATVQQRNSLNAKLQNMVSERANTIDIKEVNKTTIETIVVAENPEMYRVPAHRLGLTPKSDRL